MAARDYTLRKVASKHIRTVGWIGPIREFDGKPQKKNNLT
jgi:hypothetical protein